MLDSFSKTIFETITDPVMLIKNNRIIEVNNQLLEFFNLSSELKIVNKKLSEIFKSDIGIIEKDKIIKKKIDFEFDGRKYKSEIIAFEFDTEYLGILIRDIKDWEYDFDFSRHMNNPEIFLLINPDTGDIINFNSQALKFYGYSSEALSNMNISDINTLDQAQIRDEMDSANSEDRNYFIFRHKKADGSIESVEVYSRPVNINNRNFLLSKIVPFENKNSNQSLDDFFSKVPLGIAMIDRTGKIINVNNGFCETFKYSYIESINKNITRLICDESDFVNSEKLIMTMGNGYVVKEELERYTKYNEKLYVNITGFVFDKLDKNKIILIYSDFTEKIKSDNEIKIFKEIIKRSSEGIALISLENKIKWHNESFSEILEIDSNSTGKLNFFDLLSLLSLDKKRIEEDSYENEVVFHSMSGNIKICLVRITKINDAKILDEHYVVSLTDLTKLREKEKHIYLMGISDGLTGLYNRKYIERYIDVLIRKESTKGFVLVFLDLDHFKIINDTYGHDIGDEVLIEVSKALYLFFKEDKVSRFGGDEFLIVSERPIEKVLVDLNKFSKQLKDMKLEKFSEGVQISVGISTYSDQINSKSELIKYADIAMYDSKKHIGSKITIYDHMKK